MPASMTPRPALLFFSPWLLRPAVAVLLLAGCVQQPSAPEGPAAPASAPASAPPAAPAANASYLAPGAVDVLAVLAPAPLKGDDRYESDRRTFRATRRMAGSPRWKMAAEDAEVSVPALLQHFSCALDIESPQAATLPRTVQMLRKASQDAGRVMNVAKEHFKRQRPFWIDAGETCRDRAELGDTFDYPSGHTMAGWTWGQLLADAVPERREQLLARGRSIGESRIVCGFHNATAVEAGRLAADATLEKIRATPAYVADRKAASAELEAARLAGPRADPARCEIEARVLATPVP